MKQYYRMITFEKKLIVATLFLEGPSATDKNKGSLNKQIV